ncbi:FecCD family ABC transporter permease [Streptacidiphilus rugosus]|uniref:FecCD family ABC transporter permease n=1 Tax=Streptacidiphilus rugosus TaxID=405783 RepID=UPI000A662E59|nr:iron ABC transporter permease [Streptacidiphilus rugosus]
MTTAVSADPPSPALRPRSGPRAAGAATLLLAAVLLLSLALGAKSLTPSEVWRGLIDPAAPGYDVVHGMRLPRTLLGLLAGAALGVAGAVMRALTRNPLADPGLLGINAGASAAVVSASALLGLHGFGGAVWFALAGAGLVSVLVYAVGGGRAATPTRLVLAGAAVNAALYSYVGAVELLDTDSLDAMRFWTVGSLASASLRTVAVLTPFVLAGLALAVLLARPLGALALGEDAARALGSRLTATRAGAIAAITLLCGAATAACGPIVFVGLLTPHLVAPFTGPDPRRLLPYCAAFGPALLLGADVLGRLLARPGELQVGTVTAVTGGVLLLHLLRTRRGRA